MVKWMEIETESSQDEYVIETAEAKIEQALLRYDYLKYRAESSANEEEGLELL